jgi:NifU-like protein
MWDYTEQVMEHFLHPKNVGRIENPDGIGEVGSLACGDALTFTFKLGPDGRIADAKFQTFGCASAIASSSVLTEMVKGLTLEEAEKITNRDIVERLGGLPEQKMHCSVMGHEALMAAIANYRSKGKVPAAAPKTGRIVCTCFGVTDDEIRRVVRDNNLTTVEQVTNYCKAGGGCGGCKGQIEKLIEEVQGEKVRKLRSHPEPQPRKLTNIQKIALIQEVLQQQVRPAMRAHGGDIELIDVVGNRVLVAFRGMCASCKLADYTLKEIVEAKLHEYVSPELTVEEETDTAEQPAAGGEN